MSTNKILQIESANSEATELLGERLAANLKGGEVIELVSDLGGGKTTFVRGLVRGLGSTDHVSSPTFKLCNVYKVIVKNKAVQKLYHFDFYRLPEAGLIKHELAEALEEPDSVVVVEWGGMIRKVLPIQPITVHFTKTGENTRQISIEYADMLAYVGGSLK